MSANARYMGLVQSRAYAAQETEDFVLKRLSAQAETIRAVLHKKVSWDRRDRFTPPELRWADAYELTIVKLTEDAITFYVVREQVGDGRQEIEFFTLDRAWLHYSQWQVGSMTRKAVREYKTDAGLRRLQEARDEYARLQKVLRKEEKVYSATRKAYHAQYSKIARLRREIEQA